MIKRAVIIDHSGGELANQLWNYASVYAFSLERGVTLSNPSFYEYASWFPKYRANKIFRFIFILPFRETIRRKNSIKRKLWRKVYLIYPRLVKLIKRDAVITCSYGEPYYIPPTKELPRSFKESYGQTIYLHGWLFRNPEGLKKYRDEIVDFFSPASEIMRKIDQFISNKRKQYEHIVGVHIRQGDYRTWQGGKYFIDEKRAREILDEYLRFTGRHASKTIFIVASDGAIDPKSFTGLNMELAKGNAVEDLFLLSKTDIIIGSDSTYGDFAAYYGNIPHIVMTNSPVDWNYYRGRKTYFMGKYATWVHF